MNRQAWEQEKTRKIKEAEEELRKFERANGGKKKLKQLIKLIAKYDKLKEHVKENYWVNKLPEGHVKCSYSGVDDDFEYHYCDKIIPKKDLDKCGWYRGQYICGHPDGKYYCLEHTEKAKNYEQYIKEECGWCEQR